MSPNAFIIRTGEYVIFMARCKPWPDSNRKDEFTLKVDQDGTVEVWSDKQKKFTTKHNLSPWTRRRFLRMARERLK